MVETSKPKPPVDPLTDPDRITALHNAGLLDTPPEEAFDRFTRLVRRIFHVPVALVSLVDADRQFFKSASGLREPWASRRETPLSHSFCRHVVSSGAPLVIPNAHEDPRTRDNPAIQDLGVVAYLGVPLVDPEEYVLGSLCAISSKPRDWKQSDVELLRDLGVAAATEIRLRRSLASFERQREELEKVNQAKDRLLTMLAHELRNPLAPIRTALHVLQRARADSSTFERSRETVERQVQHLAHLTDDLLDVSRLTSGRIRLRRERIDLTHLIQEAAEDYRAAFEAAGLRLTLKVLRRPLWVRADPTRLCQALHNLIQNAIKFTEPGGRITVRVTEDAGGHLAVVSVKDTGCGIHPELLPHIFDTFTQADISLDRSGGGLGLGLALVKGLIALHRGEVRAYSAGPGQGAEFTFLLPLEAGGEPAGETAPRVRGVERALRVLVVEDSRDAAETLRDLLELCGHQVAVAHTGESGIARARRFRPEVVLCDLGLPQMDGYAVARELRRDPATAGARLIAITGYGQEEDRRRSREAGFDLHLTKPVDPQELPRILAAPAQGEGE